jgi:2-iminobutanoate/2-iminopropanoate deaminase
MPRDLSSGQIVEGTEAQAQLSMAHCLKILAAAGSSPERVMLVTVYMTDLSGKHAVNRVFKEIWPVDPPARNLVEVAAIGEGCKVEFALVALSGREASQ